MKIKEQILTEIQNAMSLNKNYVAQCNTALSDAMSLIMHEEKELQNRLEEEYKRGMNEAWEVAKEFCKISYDESMAIFDSDNVDEIIRKYTLVEIKDKMSSYRTKENEENIVHVGDVVQDNNDSTKAIILDYDYDTTLDNEQYWMVFTENGCVESWYENEFTKTGESVDLCSVLIK